MLKDLIQMMLRRRGKKGVVPIKQLEINSLCFDGEARISYSFHVELQSPVKLLAFNKALNPSLEGKGWQIKSRVERGLGWATLRIAYSRGEFAEAKGRVEGGVEDFTLSAYGVRSGRALLKDETIWHPIPAEDLVAWGFRGRLEKYRISAAKSPGCRGRLAAPGYEADEGVFEGEALHRSPGLSAIIASYRVSRTESFEVYSRKGYSRSEVEGIRDLLAEAVTLLSSKGIPAPTHSRAVELWPETDPFAQDNMVALRPEVLRGALRGEGPALYEVYTLLGAQASMAAAPESLSDYWVYESLPEALGMALSVSVGGEALRAAEKRARQLARCVEEYSRKGRLPLLGSGLPRGRVARAAVRCGAPLAFWILASREGVDALWRLVKCTVSEGVYSEAKIARCAGEVNARFAEEVLREGRLLEWLS